MISLRVALDEIKTVQESNMWPGMQAKKERVSEFLSQLHVSEQDF